jgi:hypothetical protein
VVANVHDDELLIARATDADGGLELVPLAETWRDTTGRAAAKGDLLAYLDPTAIRPRRVATDRRLVRETVQLGLFGSLAAEPPA